MNLRRIVDDLQPRAAIATGDKADVVGYFQWRSTVLAGHCEGPGTLVSAHDPAILAGPGLPNQAGTGRSVRQNSNLQLPGFPGGRMSGRGGPKSGHELFDKKHSGRSKRDYHKANAEPDDHGHPVQSGGGLAPPRCICWIKQGHGAPRRTLAIGTESATPSPACLPSQHGPPPSGAHPRFRRMTIDHRGRMTALALDRLHPQQKDGREDEPVGEQKPSMPPNEAGAPPPLKIVLHFGPQIHARRPQAAETGRNCNIRNVTNLSRTPHVPCRAPSTARIAARSSAMLPARQGPAGVAWRSCCTSSIRPDSAIRLLPDRVATLPFPLFSFLLVLLVRAAAVAQHLDRDDRWRFFRVRRLSAALFGGLLGGA